MSSAVGAGARLAWSRLGRPAALIPALAALFATVALASLHRSGPPLLAPDRALGAVMLYVVPLAAFSAVALVTGRQRLGEAAWCLARHGVSKRGVAVGLVITAAAVAAFTSLMCADLALFIAYRDHAGVWPDVVTTSWIAALGGAAHAAWFAFGSAWWRGGRGRWLPLVAHFSIAGGTGVIATLLPRAHLSNLVGGAAPMALDQPWSSALLPIIALAVVALAAWRVGR